MTPYLFLSAIAPSLLLIWYFYHHDRNPEPQKTLWATFFLGVLTVIPVLLVDAPISKWVDQIVDPYAHSAAEAFLVAGFPEEFFKYLVVVLFAMRSRSFDEPMDGIVYGAVASLGFATLENILYVSDGGAGLAVLRALTAVPGHACFGAIMGYFVGQYKFGAKKRPWLLLVAYIVPAILHGLYDFPLILLNNAKNLFEENSDLAGGLILITLGALIFAMVTTIRLRRRLRKQQDLQAVQLAQAAQLAQAQLVQAQLAQAQLAQTLIGTPGAPFSVNAIPMVPTVNMVIQPPMASFSASVSTPSPFASHIVVPSPHKSSFVSWLLLIFGGVLGTAGSTIILGFGVTLQKGGPVGSAGIAALAIFGILPVALCLFLFRSGLHRLRPKNHTGSAIVSSPF